MTEELIDDICINHHGGDEESTAANKSVEYSKEALRVLIIDWICGIRHALRGSRS
jgi:hypothetical protein